MTEQDHVLKTYRVSTPEGFTHDIDAHHVFDNDGTLVFRRGPKGATDVVASFAPGGWRHYALLEVSETA